MVPVVAACGAAGRPAPPVAVGPPTLGVADVQGLGPVLVDGRGLTLYVNPSFRASPSACDADCRSVWPPVTQGRGQSPNLQAGVDPHLVGAVALGGASRGVTYGGYGLHTYVGDGGPGDVAGEGVQHTWYAVSPSGRPVSAPPGRRPTRPNGRVGYPTTPGAPRPRAG